VYSSCVMRYPTRFLAEVVDGSAVDRLRDRTVPFVGDTPDGTWVVVREIDGAAHARGEPLARPGTALAELVRLAVDHGLDPVFSDAVEREALAWTEDPETDQPTLADLRDRPFVTIDNADSRDLDQAVLVERAGRGYRVRYAIADASFYVPRGSALFAEALRRGASYYLPGWMVPMLPRALSEGIVSLNPRVDRRALVFDMQLDASGVCTSTDVVPARIRSRAKLSYDGVQRFLDGADPAYVDAEIGEVLRLLREVGERRIAHAAARDVVRYRRRVVEVGLDARKSFVMFGGLRNDVERYGEQLSLLCNAEGARLLREGQRAPHVQPIYRVHPAPPEDRVARFSQELEAIAAARGERWRWKRAGGQSLAAYLASLPWDGEEARLSRAIQRQAILTNVRSTFRGEPGAHHGVGAEVYARFSAPMREIVGVFLHGELVEHLRGLGDHDDGLAERVIEAANDARNLQRTLTAKADRLALDALLARDQASGAVRRGTVMGVTKGKVYVTLDEPPVDVKLYRRHLGGRTFALGDAIDVRVTERDDRDRWVLEPV